MNLPLIIDQDFKKIDYTKKELQKAEYDNCCFIDCNFSETYLSNISFIDCEFVNCNLSSAKVKNTTFKDAIFTECKLLGIAFNDSNPFLMSFTFNKSNLSFSSFYKCNLNKINFDNCLLENIDFSEANLTHAKFLDCNLNQSVFNNCNLEKADFRTASHFYINPELNRLKQAKFSKEGALNLLKSYNLDLE